MTDHARHAVVEARRNLIRRVAVLHVRFTGHLASGVPLGIGEIAGFGAVRRVGAGCEGKSEDQKDAHSATVVTRGAGVNWRSAPYRHGVSWHAEMATPSRTCASRQVAQSIWVIHGAL